MFYHTIRRLHLYCTFFLAGFILMYFITGFVMVFEENFRRTETEIQQIKKPISKDLLSNKHSLVRWLNQELEIQGQYQIEQNANDVTIYFSHPGTLTSVKVVNGVDTAFITVKKGNVYSAMHDFHRLHGFTGGMNYTVWGVFNDFSAMAMILFAFSGLYLWWKTTTKRLVGMLVLLSFTVMTALTIMYLMYYS